MYTKISPVPNSSKKIERLEKSIGLKLEENNLLNIKILKKPSRHISDCKPYTLVKNMPRSSFLENV